VLRQAGVVAQHHQRHQREPGQDEDQSHDQQHHDHSVLLLRNREAALHAGFVVAPALFGHTHTAGHLRDGDLAEGVADAGVHDHDKAEGSQVNVSEEHSGVDFPHLLVGPIFSAPVEGAGVVASENNSHPLLLCGLEHDPRGTHDEHSQDPYDDDD